MSHSSAPAAWPETRAQEQAEWELIKSPLVEIRHPDLAPASRLFAKIESVQAGGSIKDRPVSRMIQQALNEGHLGGGRTLLDSSSGNAGIAYAMIGARYGVPVTLVVPGNASRERLDRMRAHGAELILTDPLDGYDEAIRTARRLAAESPELYWYSDQYSNESNWLAHYETTGQEMLKQLEQLIGAPPAAFVSGIGTGGTLTGVGRRLREVNPQLQIATVVPDIFPGIEGLKPLGHPGDLIPEILDLRLIDQRIEVVTERAVEACQWLARQGFFVGPSSGANLVGAIELSKRSNVESIITTFNDTGERYGTTGIWQL